MDTNYQWIVYDDRFQQSFEFVEQNIAEENILTEYEFQEKSEMEEHKQLLSEQQRIENLQTLEKLYPGILNIREQNLCELTQELKFQEEAANDYSELLTDMR